MIVCVDASLVLKWITEEEESPVAHELYERWAENNVILVAPTLLDYEVGSVLLKKVNQKLLSVHHLRPALAFYQKMAIQFLHEASLLEKAVSLAQDLGEPTIYDCSYLSLALWKDIDFYTCDLAFYKKTHTSYPCVKYFKA